MLKYLLILICVATIFALPGDTARFDTVAVARDTANGKVVRNVNVKIHAETPMYVRNFSFPWNNSVPWGEFTDNRDGQVYRWVRVGNQTWMAQNLNYLTNTISPVQPGYCYTGDMNLCNTYGALYSWSSAMNLDSTYNTTQYNVTHPHRGACPVGWHIPSYDEVHTLLSNMDSATAAVSLRAKRAFTRRYGKYYASTDTFGLRFLPAGYLDTNATYYNRQFITYLWTTKNDSVPARARYIYMGYSYDYLGVDTYSKKASFSIRCVKD